MSLRSFLRQTQMLIQHGLHMTRASQIDGEYALPVQASRLEERILFSASAIAPVAAELAEAGASVASLLAEPTADSDSSGDLFPISDQQMLDLIADTILPAGAEVQSSPGEDIADEQTLELVFLDSSISNLDQMMTDLRTMNENDSSRTLEFVVLESAKDGIAQITSALLRYNGIDGMHIVSHGGTGHVQLGSTWLSINNLDIYRNAISAWQYSMSDQADILFYGCNLAGSEDGQRLLQQMSILTDSDVAASEDSTGGIKRNADWDLEYQIGTITTDVAFSNVFEANADFILATYTVTNTNDSGAGSLRQAILDANANAGADTISFSLGSTGLAISLSSALPTITEQITLDGWTQSGYSGVPTVIIDGNGLIGDGLILTSTADSSIIRGLVIRDFTGDGIQIDSGSSGNTIAGNYIGSFGVGGTDLGATERNTALGINLLGSNNTIGGTTAASRNLIGGNQSHGIRITGAGASSNVVLGNYIGTDATGLVDVGNLLNGIYIDSSATNNTIGGLTATSRNVISGNDNAGIAVDHAGTTGNVIIGNYIGLGGDGTTARGNTHDGVHFNGAGSNTLGSTDSNGRNVISSNAINGVGVVDATSVTILGNYIGTDATGTVARGNASNGISVTGTASGTTIGGTATGSGNLIANNSGDGVLVSSSSSAAAAILGNSIYFNTEQGIDLGADDGLTYNDIGDVDSGSNALINFPILKTATSTGGSTTITGKVVALASTSYRVEFFSNSYGMQDTSGYGEARTYIGAVDVTTDASGIGVFSAMLSGVILETGATVTATSSRLSTGTPVATSEFAGNVVANESNLMISGSYTGNSVDNRTVAGLGFRPEVIIVMSSNGTLIRTSTMAGDTTKVGGASTAVIADGIQSLTGDGFTIGTDFRANSSGVTYHWVAYGAGDNLDVGFYAGNGTSQTISNVGFQAETAFVFGESGSQTVFRTNQSASIFDLSNNGAYASSITSLGIDSFAVGNSLTTNQSAINYHYFAFNENTNYFKTGTYTGNGADNRNITGVGFESEFLIVKATSTNNFAIGKTESTGFSTDANVAGATNQTQALQTDGFQVGSDATVNQNAVTYMYLAFRQHDAPLIVDTTSDGSDGTTTSINTLRASKGADGRISLREAIVATNNTRNVNATADAINFAINGSGVQTITVGATGLATISDAVSIDAWTQSGWSNSPLIELNGNNTGTTKEGFDLVSGSSGSTIRGFIINRFTGNGIEINSSNNHVIEGNWIGLDNTGTSASANALRGLYAINSTGLTIGGTSAASRNVISGNTQQGIYFDNVDNSFVYGNYVGTNATGSADVNGSTSNSLQTGLYLVNGSSGNQIGNTTLSGARNVFSGNNYYGVEVVSSTSQNNIVDGNYIGTNASGLASLGNTSGGFSFWGSGTGNKLTNNVVSGNGGLGILVGGAASGAWIQGNHVGLGMDGSTNVGNSSYGIYVTSEATNTLIGTNADGSNDAAEANTISGNVNGIIVDTAGTTGTMIYGNFIGTTTSGNAARGNSYDGIRIEAGATGTLVGGAGSARRNFIAANGQDGIHIDGEATDGNTIQNNWIGLAADGVTVFGNGGDGIYISGGADNTVIGGISLGNIIMGARVVGIEIDGASTGTSILGNLIGINAAGTVIHGSGENGILIENGAASTTIGGTTAGESNTIVDSGRLNSVGQSGIGVTSTAGSSNSSIGNSIYNNRGLGIDLGTTGVTANDNLDADSGANTLQNTPVLTTATTNGTTVTISGTLNTLASTAGILIHFYATPSTGSVGARQGRRYLGSTTVNTNGSGNATFTDVSLSAAVNAGELITATTTRSSNTSEFSQAIVATGQIRLYLNGVGDGSDIPVGVLKITSPTDTTLANYDPGRDSVPGAIIKKGGSGVNESDTTRHQTWISSTTETILSGPFSLSLYSAMKDFDTSRGGSITAYLIDTNSTGSSSTAIATATISRGDWDVANTGSWIKDTFNFGNISYTLNAGRFLGVKFIVSGASADDMLLAYDTTTQDANLAMNGSSTPSDITTTLTTNGGVTINSGSGNSTYLEATNGSSILGSLSQFSMEFDYQAEAIADGRQYTLASYTTPTDGDAMYFGAYKSGATEVIALQINGQIASITTADVDAIFDGNRHSISTTWSQTSGAWTVYFDGTLLSSGTGLATGQALAAGGDLVIGQDMDAGTDTWQVSSNGAFKGTFYDVRFFNDVRTASEIAANHRSTLPFNESGMVANWHMNDLSSGGVITGSVGGNDLTVRQMTTPSFTASSPTLSLAVNENLPAGIVVGTVYGTDLDREAKIASILAADSSLRYSAETGKFYKLINSTATWTTAQSNAIATTLGGISGELFTVGSAAENSLGLTFAQSLGDDIWLGLSDTFSEGVWRWYSGSTATTPAWQGTGTGYAINGAYINWGSGQPNDTGGVEDFAYLQLADGKWNDHDSASIQSSVVQWNADDVLDVTNALTYSITSQTVTGAFAINSDTGVITVANGSLLNFESQTSHTLTVRVTDGSGATYDKAFTISLNNVSIEPTNSVPTGPATNEDTSLVFSAANGNAITVTDQNGSTNSLLQVSLSVPSGTLTLSQTTGLSFPGGSNGSGGMVIVGTESDINAALNGLTFTPAGNFNGNVNLSVETALAANLQGWYTFEGGNANDQSVGTTQNGTFIGNATTITDATRGTVLTLDGSGDAVTINSTFSNPTNVTVGGWVNLNTSNARAEFISLDNRVHIALDETTNGIKGSIQTGASTWQDLTSQRFIAGTGWHHVMYVFDDTNNVHNLYIDGQLAATAANASSIYWTGATTSYIGQHPTNSAWNLNGKIDDVRVYSRALSAAEVASLAADQTVDTDTIAITVNAVNDAPVMDSTGTMTLTSITEDQTTNGGQTVASIISSAGGDRITDVDSGAIEGIAVTTLSSGNGTWQYSINSGSSWNNIGTVSSNSALLLRSSDLVRFVPNGNSGTTADLTFRAWDQTGSSAGQQGTKMDTSVNGGTSAFSSSTESALITVTSINDEQVLATNTGRTVAENATLQSISSAMLQTSDVDHTAAQLTYTLTSSTLNGTLRRSGVALGTSSTFTQLDIDAGLITYDHNGSETSSDSFSFTVDDGAGASSSGTFSISVTAVNDNTPVITSNGGGVTASINVAEGSTAVTTITATDADVPAQTLTYSIVGGADSSFFAISSSTGALGFVAGRDFDTPADAGANNIYDIIIRVDDGTNWDDQSIAVTITNVNAAPVLSPYSPTLPLTEDSAPYANTVAALLGSSVSDADASAVEGIAITSISGSIGALEYSLNGTSWTTVGSVSSASSLLLRDTDFLRFSPNGQNGGSLSITYRAWDQTSGTAGLNANTTTNGGSSAFSSATDTVTVTATSVNDAPVLGYIGLIGLTATNEDTTSTATLVSDILLTAIRTDVDSSALSGLAVTSVSANGTFQYSTDGLTWTNFGAVSSSNALLLTSTSRVRFVPNGNNGESATFNFRAWDQTTGTASINGTPGYANPGSGGGTTAYSSQSATVQITVTSVNDAPVLDNTGTMTLTTITEDDTANAGQTVASIISSAGGDRITDVDTSAVEGIAITATTNGKGSWEYSVNGGSSWSSVGTVADNSALLLRSTDMLRFVSNGQNATTGDITFRAWDQTGATAGQQGTTVNASTNGGPTAFSSATETASITVTAVNDTPVVTAPAGPLSATENQWTAIDGIGFSLSDVDAGSADLLMTLHVTQGYLTIGMGDSGVGIQSGNLTGTVVLTGTASQLNNLITGASSGFVRYVPDVDVPNATATLTITVNDQGSTGTDPGLSGDGSSEEDSASVLINVTAVNDSPTFSNLDGNPTYTEGGSSVVLDSDVKISDPELNAIGHYNGATLRLVRNGGGNSDDALAFDGTNVMASGADVIIGGTTVGTYVFTGGQMDVTFNTNATQARVNSLLQNIVYWNWSDTPSGTVQIDWTFSDANNGAQGIGGALTATGSTTVTIVAVNDEQVVATNTGVTVAENSIGNVITNAMLVTTDVDNMATQLVYTITSSTTYGTLRLNGVVVHNGDTVTQADINSGLVTYDHDGSENFSDAFSFSVDDGSGTASTGTFNITITPVNDNDPAITSNGAGSATSISIAENSTVVTTVTATDLDLPAQTLTYSIAGGADAGFFTIGSSSGSLSFTAARDFETRADANADGIYIVTLQVSDGTRTDTQTISVTITDVNEGAVSAVVDNNAATDTIVENSAIGTTVGITALASDPDGADVVTYSLTNDAGGLFAIDPNTGVVSVAGAIDREAAASHDITIRATSTDTSFTSLTVTISISDANELPVSTPVDSNATSNSVAENAANGTLVGITASAVDGDATTNTVTYSLVDDAGGRFAINATTGVVTVADGTLLNFEAATSHNITIQATSSDLSTATQVMTITLTDVNETPVSVTDAATAVEAGGTSNSVPGTDPSGNVLTNDTDIDASDTKTVSGVVAGVSASVSGSVGVNVAGTYGSINIAANGTFSYVVNNNSAAVQLLRTSSDMLTDTFTYTMTDSGGLTSTTQITVTIQGANDAPVGVNDSGTGVEAGGVANGTAGSDASGDVLTNDTDVDFGDTKTVTDIVAGSSGPAVGNVGLGVAGNYGTIILNSNGTYSYSINNSNATVQALAAGGTLQDVFTYTVTDTDLLTSTAQITITIQGANDAPVVAVNSLTISEGGTVVLSNSDLLATDFDHSAAQLIFTVSGVSGGQFELVSSVGVAITNFTQAQINSGLVQFVHDGQEAAPTYNVSVSDGSLSDGPVSAIVTFSGTNDEQVFVPGAGQTFAENSTGNVITSATLLTTDSDNTAAQLVYTLSTIPTNGILRLNGVPLNVGDTFTQADVDAGLLTYDHDGTETSSDSFAFSVDDGLGADSGVLVSFGITPVNDHTPVITSNGAGATANVSIKENTTAVTTVAASDGDLPTQSLVYSIVGGADAAKFTIDSVTGALRFAVAPDFDLPGDFDGDNLYEVLVQASDGTLSSTQMISVSITDVSSAFVVTTNIDVDDSGLGAAYNIEQLYAANGGSDGQISLREALIASNNTAGIDTITFNISGTGVRTISIASQLPEITEAVVINGQAQPDFVGTPIIQLDGANAGVADGLIISGGGSTVRGLIISNFSGNGFTLSGLGGNTIESNWIGVDSTGTAAAGSTVGIRLSSSGNTIGGTAAGAGNLIAFNSGAGIEIASTANANSLHGNAIHSNTGLGIDLGGDGVTLNDANDIDTGANEQTNFPVITIASRSNATTVYVEGTLSASASTQYRIEVFANSVGSAHSSGYGAGQRYLGFILVTTDGSGNANFAASRTASVAVGETVTATATDAAGNTSEFGTNQTIIGPTPILDLDADDSSGQSGADFIANFVEDGSPVNITDTDAIAWDPDTANLNRLTVSITNLIDGANEILAADTSGTPLFTSYSNGVLTIAGAGSEAMYQQVLRTITYDNTSQNADNTTRVLTVTIEDGVFSSNIGTTRIQMLTSNDAPQIVNNSLTITEGGTVVLTSSDLNSSDFEQTTSQLIYTITGISGGRFEFVANPGITITSFTQAQVNSWLVQFVHDGNEAAPSYHVTVGDGSLSNGPQAANVTFTGSNDAPLMNPAIFSLPENSSPGTSVGVVTSNDPDAGDAGSYSFVAGNTGGAFTVNAGTGEILVLNSAALDFETTPTFTLTLRVTDVGGLFHEASVTISLTNINEDAVTAISDSDGSIDSIAENAANGTFVGLVAFADDYDVPDSVSYSLDDDAGGRFAIDSVTGVVTVANGSLLNYENSTSHNVIVRATSTDTSFSVRTFTIALADVNEGGISAISDSNGAGNAVNENAANGSTVGYTAFATDPDGTLSSITYTLDNNAGGAFEIDSVTGIVTVANGSLLDRESAASQTIIVRATSADLSFSTIAVDISLIDVDEFDISPAADINATANVVAELSLQGTATGITVSANDADATINVITYTLDDNAGGRFQINGTTGVVTVGTTALDYEFVASYSITVRATSADSSTTTLTLTINVTDVNESGVTAIADTNSTVDSVLENAVTGSLVGITTFASDGDGTDSISYSLDNNASGRFSIDVVTGVVTVADGTLLNREAAASHSITVRATSTDSSFTTRTFTINVLDVDEFDVSPITDTNITVDAVNENAANGTAVGVTANSFDSDATANAITYGLDDNAGGRFTINSVTGIVTVANDSLLDYETAASHSITVRATSVDSSTTTRTFTIDLIDLNDTPPVITPGQQFSVSELAAVGTIVGNVAATDADGTGTLQSWTITGGNIDNVFSINAATGRITVTDITRLNFETTSSYTLTLTVSDGLETSAVETITIDIVDQNEAPVLNPSPVLSINENSANGTMVGTITGSDVDAGDMVQYSIVSSSPVAPFSIDAVTGQIRVLDSSLLNFEAVNTISLRVELRDAAGLTDIQVVTITLNDLNETPTNILLAGGTVNENSAVGTYVATAIGVDPDAGAALTYSFIDNAGGRFVIDASTGIITVASGAVLNFEVASSHLIAVQIVDAGGLITQRTLVVGLNDINEAPIAVSDQYSALQMNTLVVAVSGVLSNDSDEDGNAVMTILSAGPQNGTVTFNRDGTFSYVVSGSFFGTDTFSYYVTDGQLNSQAVTVTVEVQASVSPGGGGSGGDTTGSGDSSETAVDTDITDSSTDNTDTSESDPGLEESTETTDESNANLPDRPATSDSASGPELLPADVTAVDESATFMSNTDMPGSFDALVQTFFPPVIVSEDRVVAKFERTGNSDDLSERILRQLWNGVEIVVNPLDAIVSDRFFNIRPEVSRPTSEQGSMTPELADRVVVGSTAVVTTSLSVGYVIWILRGGSVLTAFMSAMPAWQSFDPLPILQSFERQNEDEDDSLLSIATQQSKNRIQKK